MATELWGGGRTGRRPQRLSGAWPEPAAIPAAIGAAVRRLATAFRGWQEARRAAALLSQLDQHLLRDIGLTRADITYVVTHGRDDRIGR